MPRRKKEDAEKTYHALLDAAQRVFIRQGVARTTLNHIAEEASLTRGAVYWHFENKDDLILSLWQNRMGSLNKDITNALENISIDDPVTEFRNIIHTSIQNIIDNQATGQALRIMMHCVEITDEETPLRDYLDKKRDRYFQSMIIAIKTLQENGQLKVNMPAETVAGAMLAYIYGLVQSHLEPGGFIHLERDLSALIDLFLSSFMDFEY